MEFQNRQIKWSCPTWKMSWSTPIPIGGSTSKAAPSPTGGSSSKVAPSTSQTGGSTSETAPFTSPIGGSSSKAAPSTSQTGGSTSKAAPSTSGMDGSNSEADSKALLLVPLHLKQVLQPHVQAHLKVLKALFYVSYLLFRTRPHLGPTRRSRVVPEFSLARSAWIYKGEEKTKRERRKRET